MLLWCCNIRVPISQYTPFLRNNKTARLSRQVKEAPDPKPLGTQRPKAQVSKPGRKASSLSKTILDTILVPVSKRALLHPQFIESKGANR